MECLSINNVKKSFQFADSPFRTLPVLDGISFKACKGEFIGILGPNGCGKTTLLKILTGLIKPDHGEVNIFGKPSHHTKVGYIPQQTFASLYNWLTVEENVAFASKHCEKGNVSQTLARLGIEKYACFYPYQLSGGLRQLASIARAVSVRPEFFVFDEPLNTLDYQNRAVVEEALLKLKREGNTALIVSHDIESTALLCDRLIVLTQKPSRVQALLNTPLSSERTIQTRFSPKFSNWMKKVFTIVGGAPGN
ncbi:ATP-binding cassette domain-containing protein [Candidatus Micrarchaeota archaeon]|nr:ATP-binding cassette domain-containing protein [Candidatus Micrarchaeota archaeon]